MMINLLISYKFIEYQKLSRHPYRNLEYELSKLKFRLTSNQKLRNRLTFKTKRHMQLHPSPFEKKNPIDNMIFYRLKLQMLSHNLQTKIEIHSKHK
jgi:hypothetical protein